MTEPQTDNELLQLLRDAHSALAGLPKETLEAQREGYDAWGQVLAYAETIIQDSQPALTPDSGRVPATDALTQLRDSPEPVVGRDDLRQSLLDGLARFPASRGRDAQQAATDVAERFQRSTSQRLRQLDSEFDSELDGLKQQLAEFSTTLDQLGDQAEARNTQLDAKAEEIKGTLDGLRASAEELLNEQGERFRAEHEERGQAARQLHEEQETALRELMQRVEEKTAAHLERMEKRESESERFGARIAANSTAGHFQKEADKHGTRGEFWRVVTVILGLFAIYHASRIGAVDADTAHVVGKVTLSSALLVLAGFTGKQSANHLRREKDLRDVQLKLSIYRELSDDFSDPVAEQARLFLYRSLMGQPFGETGKDDAELAGELRLLPKRDEGEADAA